MVAPGRWFIYGFLALKLLTVYVHRSTLPQSRSRSTAPSEREPGMGAHHSMYRSETATLRAIFIAPTQLKRFWIIPFIEVHSLSLAFARQLPQRGSRGWAVPFNVLPGNRKVAGDFHRPYENSKTVSLYHSSDDTPSVSHSLDSSLREGAGNSCTIQLAARKPQRCGRFSSPLRRAAPFIGGCESAAKPPGGSPGGGGIISQ